MPEKIQKALYQKVFYTINIPEGLSVCVKKADHVKKGDFVCKKIVKKQTETLGYAGSLKVEKGDNVEIGQVLSSQKRFIRSARTISKFNGRVLEITRQEIVIETSYENNSPGTEVNEIKTPFDGKIETITGRHIVVGFDAVVINLIGSKGSSVTGNLIYIEHERVKDKKKRPENLSKAIVVTDHISADFYAIASTLGAAGIICRNMNYELFSEMIILAVPAGVILEFGDGKKSDTILRYLKENEKEFVWFDSENHRLVIPALKEPSWVKNYKYELG